MIQTYTDSIKLAQKMKKSNMLDFIMLVKSFAARSFSWVMIVAIPQVHLSAELPSPCNIVIRSIKP